MKQLTKHLLTQLVALVFAFVFAQDFAGTYRDDVGDLHTFTEQADGTLLGRLEIDGTIYEVPFEIESGQAIGVLELGGSVLGFLITPTNATQLSVEVIPFDETNQPLLEQATTYTFTKEALPITQNPLSSTAQNPLTTQTPNPQSLSGVPISANQLYNAGTTLVSAAAGFSLAVPALHSASYQLADTGQAGLVISDQQGSGFMVLGLSKADVNSLVQSSLSSLGDLQLVGTPIQTSDLFRAVLQGDSNGVPIMIHVVAKQGSFGNAVIMIGFAQAGQDAMLSQALDSTLASLQLSQPTVQDTVSLGGIELYADGSSNTSNSSGDAHLTGSKEESYVFCGDGSYAYFMEDITMFSSDLASGDFGDFSSEERDQHQGRYDIALGTLSEPYLVLQAMDGRVFLHTLSESANGLEINGSSFSVTRSTQCQ